MGRIATRLHFLAFGASLLAALLSCLAAVPSPAPARSAAPTIAIISPTAGATVEGDVKITATSTAAGGDVPTSISFYDGVVDIGSEECQEQQTCTASIDWHATGLSGSHTLTATVSTREGLSTTSAPVDVTVLSPPPTVAITSPASGSTVKGTVSISVSGATAPSQVDYPTGITVYDGVNTVGSIECQGQQTCQGTVSWRATGLSGQHTLTARIHTHNDISATSPPDVVTVVSPAPEVKITSPRSGARLGGDITVSVAGSTDPSQVDYPEDIDVYDGTGEIGSVGCQGQQTCAGSIKWNTSGLKGRQVLTATIHTHDGLSANSPTVIVGGAAPRPPSPKPASLPSAVPTCHLHSLTIPLGHADHGACTVRGVPRGTHVAIQYHTDSGRWVTVVKGRVGRRGRFGFRLKGTRRATYALTILISASRSSSTTRAAIGVLNIE
jgi:hypothetical protein